MARTLRLSHAESLSGEESTWGQLPIGTPLAARGSTTFDETQWLRWRPALEPAADAYLTVAVPVALDPIAGWAVDPQTGTTLGFLADGSGGAASQAEIDRAFDRANTLIDLVAFVSDVGAFLGVWAGLSPAFGYWADLSKTLLDRLRFATKMIDQLGDPDADFTVPPNILDLGPLECAEGLRSALEGTKWGAGRYLHVPNGVLAGKLIEGLALHDAIAQFARQLGVTPSRGISNVC